MTSPYRSLLDVSRVVEVPRFPYVGLNGEDRVCYVRLAFDQDHHNVVLMLAHLEPQVAGQGGLTQNIERVALQILKSVLSDQEMKDYRYRLIEYCPARYEEHGRDSYALVNSLNGLTMEEGSTWCFLPSREISEIVKVAPSFLTLDHLDLTV